LPFFSNCIFLTGGVYTPYSPCMSTPLIRTVNRRRCHVSVRSFAAAARVRPLLARRRRLLGGSSASACTVHSWSIATHSVVHRHFLPQQQSTSSATFCVDLLIRARGFNYVIILCKHMATLKRGKYNDTFNECFVEISRCGVL